MNTEIAKKRISEVIRIDTITSSQADFLSTHVSVKNIQVMREYDENESTRSILTEEEVYQQYVRNPHNKHQFILVVGSSGAGKSHIVRWFEARLSQANLEDEVILFIKRSDNTLKGTIKQLLEKPEIRNIANREIYDRLVTATSTIDEKKLRDTIYHNFIVEIKNDDNTDLLTRIQKSRLIALLQNSDFQDRLIAEGNAIDRIYLKVAEEVGNDNRDIIPLFDENDFKVDTQMWDLLEKNGADKSAIKMVSAIIEDETLHTRVSEYMNTFVDKVIQTCAGLEPGDFEQVFLDIRREIKLRNMNLTLLIEDITAFTGVNTALLNVLTTEQTGMYEEEELCRISSIVGTTEKYFEEKFRDNYRDRVTNYLRIPNNIFGHTKNDLYEFVGRYINTMSLPRETVIQWAKNGNRGEDYPVHQVVEGRDWDYFTTAHGQKLCLYPFTKVAILNLYKLLLQPDYQTPRYLLRDVIERTINNIIKDKVNFPSFKIENIPIFSNQEDRVYLQQKISDEIQFDRMRKFICVWGDGTLYEKEVNDQVFLAGINKSIYRELEFADIAGIRAEVKVEESKKVEGNGSATTIKEKADEDLERRKNEDTDRIIKTTQEISQEKIDFQQGIKMLDLWMAGHELNVGPTTRDVGMLTKARDKMNDYLFTAINWQAEKVSLANVLAIKEFTKIRFVGFDRQKRGADDMLISLPANQETYNVIVAFLGFVTLGKSSWDFDGASMMVYQIQNWTESVKHDLIHKVNTFENIDLDYHKCAIASEIIRSILWGEFKESKLVEYNAIKLLEKSDLSIDQSNNHCLEWNKLKALMIRQDYAKVNQQIINDYYNLVQGHRIQNVKYIDYYELNNSLSEVIKNNLMLDKTRLDLYDPIKPRREIRDYYRSIVDRIESVCSSEVEKTKEMLGTVKKVFMDYIEIDDDDILDFIILTEEFYQQTNNMHMNITYDGMLIQSVRNNAKNIITSIKLLDKAINESDMIKKMILFSRDPLMGLSDFVKLIKKISDDSIIANDSISRKIAGIRQDSTNKQREELFKKYTSLLEQNLTKLQSMEVEI